MNVKKGTGDMTLTSDDVLVDVDGRLGWITLNRPEKLNAITDRLRKQFEVALDALVEDDRVRVIIVRGSGRAFCAGYDLNPGANMEATPSGQKNASTDLKWVTEQVNTWKRLWECSKPTIAMIHGHCVAGGMSLAMECDIVIAAEDATFGQPEARAVGIAPDHALWPLTIGLRKTKELLFTADFIDAKTAAALGMINYAIVAEQLESFTREIAGRMAKTSVEMLAINKASVNAAAEAMGIAGVRESGIIYDVVAHLSKTAKAWRRTVREHGVREGMKILEGEN